MSGMEFWMQAASLLMFIGLCRRALLWFTNTRNINDAIKAWWYMEGRD